MDYLSNINFTDFRMDSKEKIPKVYLSIIKFSFSFLLMIILLLPCCCGVTLDDEIAKLKKIIQDQATAAIRANTYIVFQEVKLDKTIENVNELSKRINYLEKIQPSFHILQNKLDRLNESTNEDISKLLETIKKIELQTKCKKEEQTELDRNYEETNNNFQKLQRMFQRTSLDVDNMESNQNSQYKYDNKLHINDNELQPLFKQLDEIKQNQQFLIDEFKKKVSELKPEFVQVDVQLNLIKHQQNQINELQQKLYKIHPELTDVKKPFCQDKEQAEQVYANVDQTTNIKGDKKLDQRKNHQDDLTELQHKINIMQPQLISVIQQLNQSRHQHQYEINELQGRINTTIQKDIISFKEQLGQNKQQQEHDKHELQYKIDNIIQSELINVKEQLNKSKEQNQQDKNELKHKIDNIIQAELINIKEQLNKSKEQNQHDKNEFKYKIDNMIYVELINVKEQLNKNKEQNQHNNNELKYKIDNTIHAELINVKEQLNKSKEQNQHDKNELKYKIDNIIQAELINVKKQLNQIKEQNQHNKNEMKYNIDNIIHAELTNVKEQLNQSKEQNQHSKNELKYKIEVIETYLGFMKEQFVKHYVNVQDSLKELQAKEEDLDIYNKKHNDKLLNCSKFTLSLLNKHDTWTGNKWENFVNKRLLNSSKVFQEDFVSLILDVYGNVNSEDSRDNNFGLNYVASLLTCQFLVTALPAKEYQNIQTKVICEHFEDQLQCVNGQRIQIIDAFYGRHSALLCDTTAASNTNCKMPITHLVSKHCNQKTTCHLRANNDVYGDPCWGVVKYINVYFICYK